MWTLAENFAGSANGICNSLHASDAASTQSAAPGVESLVVFHDDHGFFDCVERRSAPIEDAPSGGSGVAHTVAVSVHHVIGNGPGTAVDNKNRIRSQTPSQ